MDLTQQAALDVFRAPPDRHVDVVAGEVAVRTVGRGPDVLFVHGWPVSGATFRRLLPHLSDHVTCHVIDLPGAGDSRYDDATPLTIHQHIRSVARVVDALGLDEVVVVGHDSGGLIARHAVAGDPRVTGTVLIDTEPLRPGLRFRAFLAIRHLPRGGDLLGWAVGRPRLRRHPLVLGGAFADRSHLDGEFDELFLRPLHEDPARRAAAMRVLRSFDHRLVEDLPAVHARIDAPVHLVWGAEDVFFPVDSARQMVGTFPDARLTVVDGAGLFSHEEAPEAVARAILATVPGVAT